MNLPLNVEVPLTATSLEELAIPEPAGVDRVGVLVLGMHRSGTSALARMLNLLGCALPLTPMPPAFDNPEGHWESAAAMQFNDELLALAGSRWDDWLPVGDGFFAAPGYRQLVARGVELLRAEFGSAPLFVFKDPRNCRLARFWLDVFAAEAISPAVVIPIRNPLEVARSLSTRDQADEHYGPLLWLRHVLDAEAASRGRRRVFTSYDQLIESWEVVTGRLQTGLGIAWPRMSPATQQEIGAYIDKRHRRQQATPAAILSNPLVSSWVRRAYDILNNWAADGEIPADHAELDAIARAFADAAPAFARLVLHGTQARQRVNELEAQAPALHAAAARAAELEAALGQADVRAAEAAAQSAQQLASQNDLLSQNVAQALAERDALQSRIDELAGLRDAAEGSTAALAARNELLLQDMAQALAERDALQGRIDELAGLRDAAEGKAVVGESRIAELEWLLGEAQAKIDAGAGLQGQLAELAGLRDAAERQAVASESRIGELEWLLAEAQAKVEAGAALQEQLAELASLRDAAESKVAGIDGQNAELRWLLGEAQARVEAASERLGEAANAIAIQDNRIAEQASALIQRREENEQAWSALAQEQAASADLRRQLAASSEREEIQRRRLADADAEVMRLAAERQAAQNEAWFTQAAAERAKEAAEAEAERRAQDMARRLSDAQASKAETEARLGERFEEVARMTALLGRAEREAEAAGAQAEAARAALDQQAQTANASQARSAELAQQVVVARQEQASADKARQELAAAQVERFNELAVLTRLLRDRERETDQRNDQIEWLRKLQMAFASMPFWWALLPRSWRRQHELGVLQRKQLFDPDAYLARYPDVAAAGMDPLRHYLGHGMNEGRLRGDSEQRA